MNFKLLACAATVSMAVLALWPAMAARDAGGDNSGGVWPVVRQSAKTCAAPSTSGGDEYKTY
jgi:hypothetical protein